VSPWWRVLASGASRGDEAPWSTVPLAAWLTLAGALLANALWQPHVAAPAPSPPAALAAPPPLPVLRLVALGEPELLARLLLVGLFGPAASVGMAGPAAWMGLDYERLTGWLAALLELDPTGQAPLLAAARLFGEVPDPERQRRMLAFIRQHYVADPMRRWPWLAHAVFVARHRLHDLPLALDLARELAAHADPAGVPAWARQMHLFVLEDMGEVEAVKVLIGGLLASGRLEDPNERHFLEWRLRQMEQAAGDANQARRRW